MPASLPPHSNDDDGRLVWRAASGLRNRNRLRTQASAWHHHRRRTHRQPDADALHHARCLSVLRSPPSPVQGQTTGGPLPWNRGGLLTIVVFGVFVKKEANKTCGRPVGGFAPSPFFFFF